MFNLQTSHMFLMSNPQTNLLALYQYSYPVVIICITHHKGHFRDCVHVTFNVDRRQIDGNQQTCICTHHHYMNRKNLNGSSGKQFTCSLPQAKIQSILFKRTSTVCHASINYWSLPLNCDRKIADCNAWLVPWIGLRNTPLEGSDIPTDNCLQNRGG